MASIVPQHSEALLKPGPDDADVIHHYPHRWWILAVYSSFALFQGWAFNAPGGVAASWVSLYDISNYTIQILLVEGNVAFLLATPAYGYLIDQPNGLRLATLSGCVLAFMGALLRLAAVSSAPWSIALLHGGNVLNAVAGPAAMCCVSKVAENWFPVHERGLATAVAAEAVVLGSSLAFVVGPALVPDSTWAQNLAYGALLAGLLAASTVGCLLYYPSRPPTPPSRSASGHSIEAKFTLGTFWEAVRTLSRNRNFVIVALTYGLGIGMQSSWGGVITLNLQSVGIDQATAGWIGFGGTLAGVAGGLAVGHAVDRCRNHKAVVVGGLLAAATFFAYFAALTQKLLPAAVSSGGPAVAQAAVATVGASFFCNSVIPVMFEQSVESSYPVPEGTVVGVLQLVNSVGSIALLMVPLSSAAAAFNWLVVATVGGVALLMAACFADSSRRLRVDLGQAAAEAIGGVPVDDDDGGGGTEGEEEEGQQGEPAALALANGGLGTWSRAASADGLLVMVPALVRALPRSGSTGYGARLVAARERSRAAVERDASRSRLALLAAPPLALLLLPAADFARSVPPESGGLQ